MNLKKISFIGFTVIVSLFLFLGFVQLQAQTADQAAAVTDASPDIMAVVTNTFTTIAALAAMVVLATAFFKRLLNSNDAWTRLISGITALLLSVLGWLLQIGIFAGVAWFYIFIYGLSAALVANGLATYDFIKTVLMFIKLKTPAN